MPAELRVRGRTVAWGTVPRRGYADRRRTRCTRPRASRVRVPALIIVMPAYNAARTLQRTYADIPHELVDQIILVDDVSADETVEIAGQLGLDVIIHRREPRLRRQPEDVLRRGAGGRRRHRGHAPPRLPVRRDADPGPDRPDRGRLARPDAGQPVPGRSAGRRDAALEVRQQPLPDRAREPGLRAAPVRVPHRPAGLQPPPARDHPVPAQQRRLRVRPGADRPGRGGRDDRPDRRDRRARRATSRRRRRSGSGAASCTGCPRCGWSAGTSSTGCACGARPSSRRGDRPSRPGNRRTPGGAGGSMVGQWATLTGTGSCSGARRWRPRRRPCCRPRSACRGRSGSRYPSRPRPG